MDVNTLLYLTGATGFFTSRAFLPAFLTAVALKYGAYVPFIGEIEFLKASANTPTWLTHDFVILGLGALALAEIFGEKIPEVQEGINTAGKYVKPGVAALVALGVLGSNDGQYIEDSFSLVQAGFLDLIPSGGLAGLVYFFSNTRATILEILAQADEDDDLGLRGLISWAEDLWAGFGLLVLLAIPAIMAVIVAISLGLMYWLMRYLRKREEKQQIQCAKCHASIMGSAIFCPECGAENSTPKRVGWLGQTTKEPVTDIAAHRFNLLEKRRCKCCATHFKEKGLNLVCVRCGDSPFADREFAHQYMRRVTKRLPLVLGVGALFSLVPVAGLIAGIIYYRVRLVTPFRAYIPMGANFARRWALRIFFFFLIGLQIIPIAGAAVVPIMAFTSYVVYRGSFVKRLDAIDKL